MAGMASGHLRHHDTKAGDGLPRGHSLLNGALDVSLYLKREADAVVFRSSKNRNSTTEQDFAFTIATRRLGTDEDGDPITTAVCLEADATDLPRKADRLPPAASAALLHLRQLSPDGKPVAEAAWHEACVNGRNVSQSDVEKNRRDVSRRAIGTLTQKELIEFGEGLSVCRPHMPRQGIAWEQRERREQRRVLPRNMQWGDAEPRLIAPQHENGNRDSCVYRRYREEPALKAISQTELAEIDALVSGPPPVPGVVTAAELGQWLNLAAPRVSALAREGRIPRRADGRFDLQAAIRGAA